MQAAHKRTLKEHRSAAADDGTRCRPSGQRQREWL